MKRLLAAMLTLALCLGIGARTADATAPAAAGQVNVTITYTLQNDGGAAKQLSKPTVLTGKPGKKYKVSAPSISGYKKIAVNDPNNGKFGKTNSAVDVKYVLKSAKKATITMKHVDAASGKSIAKNTKFTCYTGAPVTYTPKAVKGYDQPASFIVNTKTTKGTITIQYTKTGTASNSDTAAPQSSTQSSTQSSASAVLEEMFNDLNKVRVENGVKKLTMDADLMAAAAVRAKEIPIKFSHTRPDGTQCGTVSSKAAGENIAMQSSHGKYNVTTDLWMSSEGHRENMLRAEFKTVGFGYYETGGKKYYVQLFGR